VVGPLPIAVVLCFLAIHANSITLRYQIVKMEWGFCS